VVLWWFPKAGSGECTMEGIRFEAMRPQFEAAGAQIVGISMDDAADNCTFQQAHGFGYPLLSDPDQAIAGQYGTARPDDDDNAGMPLRTTHLIDPSGSLARIYNVTDVHGHAEQVLADLIELSSVTVVDAKQ
jgi:peroxiredoxin Q/BCP